MEQLLEDVTLVATKRYELELQGFCGCSTEKVTFLTFEDESGRHYNKECLNCEAVSRYIFSEHKCSTFGQRGDVNLRKEKYLVEKNRKTVWKLT